MGSWVSMVGEGQPNHSAARAPICHAVRAKRQGEGREDSAKTARGSSRRELESCGHHFLKTVWVSPQQHVISSGKNAACVTWMS